MEAAAAEADSQDKENKDMEETKDRTVSDMAALPEQQGHTSPVCSTACDIDSSLTHHTQNVEEPSLAGDTDILSGQYNNRSLADSTDMNQHTPDTQELNSAGNIDTALEQHKHHKQNHSLHSSPDQSSIDKTSHSEQNSKTIDNDSAETLNKEPHSVNQDQEVQDENGAPTKDRSEEDGDEDVDPLSLDMYERLCVESGQEKAERLQWDNYNISEDLQKACKKLSCTEKQFYTIIMTIFAAMTFAMVFGLFVLQAQLAMNAKEMVSQVQAPKKPIPQGVYTLYFDYLEAGQLDKVDLRANTSIFVH